MEITETIRIALNALKSNKLRAGLTMLGIIIGISSVILLIAIGNGLKTYITDQLEGLGANTLLVIPGEFDIATGSDGGRGTPGAGVAASKFTFDHLDDLKSKGKTIKTAMAYNENNGTLRFKGETKITQITGVGPEFPELRDQKVTSGTFFNQSQYNTAKKVVVLGSTLVDDLFQGENPIGQKMTISDQRYTVIGVLEEKGSFSGVNMDNIAYIPATTSMRQFDLEYLQSLWIQAADAETTETTKTEIEKILLETLDDDEFSVLDTKSLLSVVTRVLSTLTAALAGIAAISLIVGGIGVMNIMLVSVRERTREIGLRKAIGATPQNILVQFLVEAIVLSLVGGLVGIALGVFGALAIGRFFTTTITFWSVALSAGVSTLVGIVFGVTPAYQASRLNPIEALRFE